MKPADEQTTDSPLPSLCSQRRGVDHSFGRRVIAESEVLPTISKLRTGSSRQRAWC